MLPKTASEALQAWDRRELIDTFKIHPGAGKEPMPDQGAAYGLVFEILRHALAAGAVGEKTSYRQFDSWCFAQALAVPAKDNPPEAISRLDAIKGFCYGVLREGWANVVNRHTALPRIQIRKP